jgi:tRNA 5-methylaminomethyl-2-thiouridine biosynthesis bifunctional protein
VFGATFDRIEMAEEAAPDAASSARNRAALARLAPAIAETMKPEGAWAGVRASVNDRMPVAGLAPDYPAWMARFAGLKDGRPPDLTDAAPSHEGLYLLGALGARGFSLAPALGERIVSEALGEPQMLDRGVLEAIHPARFLVRALKRGRDLPL